MSRLGGLFGEKRPPDRMLRVGEILNFCPFGAARPSFNLYYILYPLLVPMRPRPMIA